MGVLVRILISLAGLGIVAWVVQGIDLAETGSAILGASLPYLALGLLLFGIGVFLRIVRWRYMLSPRKLVSLRALVTPLAIGYAIGNVTATGVGAVPRSMLVARTEGMPASYVLGTVLLEFVMDAAVVVSWAAVASFLVDLPPALAPLPYLLALFAVVIYLVILAFKRRRSLLARALPLSRLIDRLPAEWRQGWVGFQEGASEFLNRPSTVSRVGILTMLIWIVEASLFWVLMLAAGIGASWAQGSVVMSFTHVVIGIPSLPGFVGTLDAAALTSLGTMGLDGARALSYTLIVHAYQIVPLTVAGALMAWREGFGLTGKGWKDVRGQPPPLSPPGSQGWPAAGPPPG